MSVFEVKLLLEGFCEQETVNVDRLVLLSLQATVTSEGCGLQKCIWHQGHRIREIGLWFFRVSPHGGPRAPALCLQHSETVIQQYVAIRCHPCFW